MDIILGIFLKGAGWQELWQEALMLTAIGAALYVVALGVFRQRIV
jgi:ABC-2 type transport system permease protein